uniref:Uncharacterized protein n=1 Tax=Anguilla anguilla TaxID=7936 RepID=A0A0E9Y105_ANGAN
MLTAFTDLLKKGMCFRSVCGTCRAHINICHYCISMTWRTRCGSVV